MRRLEVRALWPETPMIVELIDLMEQATCVPLGDVYPPPAPGVYALVYRGKLRCYTEAADTGWPIYIGASKHLAFRAGRHRRKVLATSNLEFADLAFASVVTDGWGAALHAEQLLIDAYVPVWNQRWMAGWGSNRKGRHRLGQRKSPFEHAHPIGPPVSDGAPGREVAGKIRKHLSATVSGRRRCVFDAPHATDVAVTSTSQ